MERNIGNEELDAASTTEATRLRQFLELHVWPTIPHEANAPWSPGKEDSLLGYGEWGEPI